MSVEAKEIPITLAQGRQMRFQTAKGDLRVLLTLISIGRPHITVIAALGAFTFGWLFTGRYQWFLTIVVALDWYVVNLINRIVDLKEDRANAITGTGFIKARRRTLLGGGLALLFISFPVVHLVIPAITGLRILSHLLGASYNWAILPGKRRLKQLYFWKNTASAVGFLLTLFAYPLAVSDWGSHGFPPGVSWASVFVAAAFFFCLELSYEVIYDLRDVRGDALARVRTYAVVHGEAVAVHIIDGLIFASMAALALGYALSCIPWRIFIMIIPAGLQFIIYKRALPRGIQAKDCIRLTWMGAALIVLYHLWVVAGLPGAGL